MTEDVEHEVFTSHLAELDQRQLDLYQLRPDLRGMALFGPVAAELARSAA